MVARSNILPLTIPKTVCWSKMVSILVSFPLPHIPSVPSDTRLSGLLAKRKKNGFGQDSEWPWPNQNHAIPYLIASAKSSLE